MRFDAPRPRARQAPLSQTDAKRRRMAHNAPRGMLVRMSQVKNG